ncbi:hypothetical protein CAEBREN_20929 [Caenorhabditis brenneri]|uniref:Uncharacterized protein n=1 Tax=Caenorhabditis brenneri TaxID=135651 RepID=G0NKF9_CAEBE|nr:hypothetical protein CAEBREN_20929 [Caenorhabditis brenneri]
MMNAQNSPKGPETIKEALDQMFKEKPAPPRPRKTTIEKLMDAIFLHEVEITPRMVLRPLMSRRPPVQRVERTADQQPRRRHNQPPGPGASPYDWQRFFCRKMKKMLGRNYHQNEPVRAFSKILRKLSPEDKANFEEVLTRCVKCPELWRR